MNLLVSKGESFVLEVWWKVSPGNITRSEQALNYVINTIPDVLNPGWEVDSQNVLQSFPTGKIVTLWKCGSSRDNVARELDNLLSQFLF